MAQSRKTYDQRTVMVAYVVGLFTGAFASLMGPLGWREEFIQLVGWLAFIGGLFFLLSSALGRRKDKASRRADALLGLSLLLLGLATRQWIYDRGLLLVLGLIAAALAGLGWSTRVTRSRGDSSSA